MIRDTISTRFIFLLVFIVTLSHRTTGGGNWKRLERMFIQDQHHGEHWDENRIIFPDTLEDHLTEASWSPTTPRHDSKRPCQANCPVSREYNPVCGTNGITYQNMAQLQCAIRCGVAVDLHRPSPCPNHVHTTTSVPLVTPTTPMIVTHRNEELEQCIWSCPSTPEYNPVCGTNQVTYNNIGKLQCAKTCGVTVQLWRHSPCPTSQTSTSTTAAADIDDCVTSCPTTPEYNPVCGTNDVTYFNVGKLNCAKLCGLDVSVQSHGRCASVTDVWTSEEDYGEGKINPRFRPRKEKEQLWQ